MRWLAVILFLIPFQLFAQDPLFSTYYENKLWHNPAYAGVEDSNVVSLTFRNQWPQFKGSPISVAGAFDTHIDKINSGVGAVYLFDQIGQETLHQFGLIYNYKIKFTEKMNLRLGTQVNVLRKTIDFDAVIGPPPLPTGTLSGAGVDLNFGLWYNWSDFYLGVSTRHTPPARIEFREGNTIWGFSTNTRYYLMTGHSFRLLKGLSTTPSVRVVIRSFGPYFRPSYDINNTFLIDIFTDLIYLGTSFRSNGAESLILNGGIQFKNGLMLMVAYDLASRYSGNALELTTKYKF